jgi:hypothetical protein
VFLVLLIFDTGVETRNTLKRAQIDVHLCLFRRGGRRCRDATTTDCDVEGLEVVGEVREDETIVRADLVRRRICLESRVFDYR